MKAELRKIQRVLRSEYDFRGWDEDREDGQPGSSSRHALLKITLDFLKIMKQEHLADCLQSSKTFKKV